MKGNQWLIDEETFVFREVGGEFILLNLKTDEYYTLNEVGSEIFHLLVEDRSAEEIVATVAAAYEDVSQARIAQDLDDLIEELRACGILRVISP